MGASSVDGPPNEIDPVGPWQPGPLEPPPLDAALHVWRVRLTAVDDRALSALGDDERERAARIVGERPRELWMRSRGVLRELLGRYSRDDPRAIVLSTGTHGKPALASVHIGDRQSADGPPGGAAEAELAFNLSHSGELALYAFARGRSVGIDVEFARSPGAGGGARETDHVALARRTFGATRAARLAELEPALREREFLRWWTTYEAELKRRGTGIGGLPDDEASCWVAELDVGPRAAAAVACEPAPRELLRFEWT